MNKFFTAVLTTAIAFGSGVHASDDAAFEKWKKTVKVSETIHLTWGKNPLASTSGCDLRGITTPVGNYILAMACDGSEGETFELLYPNGAIGSNGNAIIFGEEGEVDLILTKSGVELHAGKDFTVNGTIGFKWVKISDEESYSPFSLTQIIDLQQNVYPVNSKGHMLNMDGSPRKDDQTKCTVSLNKDETVGGMVIDCY